MSEIGQQSVGEIDGAVRDAAQAHAQRDPRLRRIAARASQRASSRRAQSQPPLAMRHGQRSVAEPPGHPDFVARSRAVAAQRLAARHFAR